MFDHILAIHDAALVCLPRSFVAPAYRLDLDDCVRLRELPDPFAVPVLSLRRCVALERLPSRLDVVDLDATGCVALRELRDLGPIMGRLILRDCAALHTLGSSLTRVAELDLTNCNLIRNFDSRLTITRSLEVAGTRLDALPQLGANAKLRWRGVIVSADVVLHPDRIDSVRVVSEANAELRRVLVERMGYQRFVDEVGAVTVDQDRDPGGSRALLRVSIPDDEPLLLLSCRCPSTGRQYLLRVPPSVQRCHEAAAWIAGFDDPRRYSPVKET